MSGRCKGILPPHCRQKRPFSGHIILKFLPNFSAFSFSIPIQIVPFRKPLTRLKSRRLDRTKFFHAQRQKRDTQKTSFRTGDNVRGPCSDRPRFRNVLAPSRRLGRLRVGDDGGCCWELSKSRGVGADGIAIDFAGFWLAVAAVRSEH